MIRPLRTAHARLWLVILPIALAALVVALLMRPPRPVQPDATPQAAPAPPSSDVRP